MQHGRVNLEPFGGGGRLELKGKGQDRPDGAEEADSICVYVSTLGSLMDQRPDQIMRQDGGGDFRVHILDLLALQHVHLERRFERPDTGLNFPPSAIQFDDAGSRVPLGVCQGGDQPEVLALSVPAERDVNQPNLYIAR